MKDKTLKELVADLEELRVVRENTLKLYGYLVSKEFGLEELITQREFDNANQ